MRLRLICEERICMPGGAEANYEIGMQTEDGAVVAHVRIWEGTAIDRRSENEREEAALEKQGWGHVSTAVG